MENLIPNQKNEESFLSHSEKLEESHNINERPEIIENQS
jgi:hypothetical protein